jgi:hypothetical protein
MLTSVICCVRQFFHHLLYNPFRVVARYIYVYVHVLLNAVYSAGCHGGAFYSAASLAYCCTW